MNNKLRDELENNKIQTEYIEFDFYWGKFSPQERFTRTLQKENLQEINSLIREIEADFNLRLYRYWFLLVMLIIGTITIILLLLFIDSTKTIIVSSIAIIIGVNFIKGCIDKWLLIRFHTNTLMIRDRIVKKNFISLELGIVSILENSNCRVRKKILRISIQGYNMKFKDSAKLNCILKTEESTNRDLMIPQSMVLNKVQNDLPLKSALKKPQTSPIKTKSPLPALPLPLPLPPLSSPPYQGMLTPHSLTPTLQVGVFNPKCFTSSYMACRSWGSSSRAGNPGRSLAAIASRGSSVSLSSLPSSPPTPQRPLATSEEMKKKFISKETRRS